MPIEKDVDLKKMIKETEGWTGADIEAACRFAGVNSIKRNYKEKDAKKLKITKEDFEVGFKAISLQKGNWGDNCIAQALKVKSVFCNANQKFLYLVSGRHRTLLYQDNNSGNVIFLDPYLMHKYPIIANQFLLNPGYYFEYPVYTDTYKNKIFLNYNKKINII